MTSLAPPMPSSATVTSSRRCGDDRADLDRVGLRVALRVRDRLGDRRSRRSPRRCRRAACAAARAASTGRVERAAMLRIAPASPSLVSSAGGSPCASSRSSSIASDSSLPARSISAAALGRRRRVLGGEPQVDRQRGQPLLGAVVEVAHDPPPLGVGRLDEAGARGAQALAERLSLGHDRGEAEGRHGRDGDEQLGADHARADLREHERALVVRRVPGREADGHRRPPASRRLRRSAAPPRSAPGTAGTSAARGCGARARRAPAGRRPARPPRDARSRSHARGGGRDHARPAGRSPARR